MDVEYILNEVERERRAILIHGICEMGLGDENQEIRKILNEAIGLLRFVNTHRNFEMIFGFNNFRYPKKDGKTEKTLEKSVNEGSKPDLLKFRDLLAINLATPSSDFEAKVSFLNQHLSSNKKFIRLEVARILGLSIEKEPLCDEFYKLSDSPSVLKILPKKTLEYFELFMKGLSDKDKDVRLEMAKSLNKVARKTLDDKVIVPIRDDEYNFVKDYLNSDYINEKEGERHAEEKLLEELVDLVQMPRDYHKLKEIFEAGQAKNLAEILEYAEINIPGYTILRRLGEGADGIVYEADSKVFGKIKVKIFKDPEDKIKKAVEQEGVSLEERIKRRVALFDKQIRDKTHFTQLYEVGSCVNPLNGKKTIYLTSDYIPGGAAEAKDSDGNYTIREDVAERVFEIFPKILDGFEELHKSGLVLKDVKLRNILVGYTYIVLIDDLETIADWRDVDLGERLTEGSDRYAAPEVMDDITNAGFHSDIYSLGVCLLYMITKKPTLITEINKIENADKYHDQLELILKENKFGYKERKFFHRALARYYYAVYPHKTDYSVDSHENPPKGCKFVRFKHIEELKKQFIKTFTQSSLARFNS